MALATPDAVFIHGVRSDDEHWTDAWNFSLAGTRGSIGLLNLAQGQLSPYAVDVSVLAGPPQAWPPMFLSGFMSTLRLGAIIRSGGRIGWGVPPHTTQWATEESQSRVLKNADRELALEAGRRTHAPEAPSRLCCLWLAENTAKGRNWVASMMGPHCFVMRVKVTVELVSFRCDARWLDRVQVDPHDDAAVAAYWSGAAEDDDPLWEYLLEGQIAANDQEELDRLREFIRIHGPPPSMVSAPPADGGANQE